MAARSNGTESLDRILGQVNSLRLEVQTSDELEAITDELVELLLERLPIPRWLPFFKGWARQRLDDFLPLGLFNAIEDAARAIRDRRRMVGPA